MRRNWLVGLLPLLLCFAWPGGPALGRPLGYTVTASDTLLYLAGNSIVDIEYDTVLGVPVVWAGTGNGASVSTDLGLTWRAFTSDQGLNANSISALLVTGDTVWVGMAHNQDFNGSLFPVGDGFNFSVNNGNTWDTAAPAQSTGIGYFAQQVFGMLPFDLAADPYGLWAATFFGGLIRSIDGGQSWINIFPADSSRQDFEAKAYTDLGNRFFSVTAGAADAAGDTIEVFAGSAGGINRFLIIDAKRKLAGAPVFSLHTDSKSAFDWLATGGGVSRVSKAAPRLVTSYFDSTTGGALTPGLYLSSASPFTLVTPEMAIFGAFDTTGGDTLGAGLVRTFDNGDTWEHLTAAPFTGAGAGAYDLMFTHEALWAAAGDSGLQRSTDLGATWERVALVDTLITGPGSDTNRVYALAYDSVGLPTHLYAGTFDGIYRLTLGGGDNVVAYEPPLYTYPPGDTTRAQVIRSTAAFHTGSGDLLLWAAAHRNPADPLQRSTSLFSNDSGVTWQTVRLDLVPFEFAYDDDTVFAATNGGLLVVPVEGIDTGSIRIDRIFEAGQGRVDSLELLPAFRCVENIRDTVWLGGDAGYARRRPGNFDWDIEFFVPRDSVDLITSSRFNVLDDSTITGDFVIALHIQNHLGNSTVWASTRPVETPQFLGVSRSTDHGRTWNRHLPQLITWNLDSFNEHVWAATSGGLYHTTNSGVNWARVPIVDARSGLGLTEKTEVLSVQQIDDTTVLAGSEDGIGRSTDLGATWEITRSFVGVNTDLAGGADVDVFASPVPFSPVSGTRLRIHYKPEQDASVRIEVFDFAMQKVATVLDGAFRAGRPGPDPFGTNHYYEEWDATNDGGERVATGVYFFRVDMDGDARWGKLVILP